MKKGKKHSYKTLEKMSDVKIGEDNPMYGKKHSEETKQKMRDAAEKRKNNKLIMMENPMFRRSEYDTIKKYKSCKEQILDGVKEFFEVMPFNRPKKYYHYGDVKYLDFLETIYETKNSELFKQLTGITPHEFKLMVFDHFFNKAELNKKIETLLVFRFLNEGKSNKEIEDLLNTKKKFIRKNKGEII